MCRINDYTSDIQNNGFSNVTSSHNVLLMNPKSKTQTNSYFVSASFQMGLIAVIPNA